MRLTEVIHNCLYLLSDGFKTMSDISVGFEEGGLKSPQNRE